VWGRGCGAPARRGQKGVDGPHEPRCFRKKPPGSPHPRHSRPCTHKRNGATRALMSAFPPTAAQKRTSRDFRVGPASDITYSFESGAISRPWRSNENIGVCDYASAFTTQRMTLRIIPVRVVAVATYKLYHSHLHSLVYPLLHR